MDTKHEIREFLTSRRAKLTPEQAGGSRSEQTLNLLASWAATVDETETTHAT